MKRLAGPPDDEGFTLIELLVVVAVLPLVVGAIAVGMISTFQNGDTTKTRLSDSHDAQITSTYFVRDVESAQFVSTSTTPLCGSDPQLLGLSWSSLTSAGAVLTNNASYSIAPTTNTLVRTYCGNGAPTTSVLAHDAFPAAPTPTVSPCPPTGDIGVGATACGVTAGVTHAAVTTTCTDGSTTCAGTGPIATTAQTAGATGISRVQLDVLESGSGFAYHLTAAPHGWTTASGGAPGGGTPGTPALTLIGDNPGGSFQGSGSCTLNVNGVAAINTATDGAITENNDDFNATGGVYAQTENPISGPGAPIATISPPLADPYAGLVPPTSASTPPVTVVSGTFHPSGTLNGIYILQNGLSLSGNPTITTGPAGVLLYVTHGSIDLTGGSSVTLSAPVAGYAPIVIWIDKDDTGGSLSLGGNGNVTTIGGTIYAPTGSVTLNGGGHSGGTSAGAIVANNLSCQGGGNGVGFSAGPIVTSTVVTSSANPATSGQPFTLTAQVTGVGATVNSGTVAFEVDDRTGTPTAQCATAAPVDTTGKATCIVTGNLAAASGPYTVTAVYQGNAAFGPSTSSAFIQTVLTGTTTAVSASPAPPLTPGQSVAFSATVTADDGSTPTGSVTFAVTGLTGAVTCTGGNTKALANGVATCQTSGLHAAGSPYSATATYAQNAPWQGSTSGPVSESVTPLATVVTVTSSRSPASTSDTVTFTATVAPTPTDGTVSWSSSWPGAVPCAPSSSVTATCTVPASGFPVGSTTVTATYAPGASGDYLGSSGSVTQQVTGSPAKTTTTASLSKAGNTRSDKATVAGTGQGNNKPTGSVSFFLCANSVTGCAPGTNPGSLVGTVALSNGNNPTATFVVMDPTRPGSYCLAAYYSGDGTYAASADTSGDQCFVVP